jgi:hypothetical protein
MLCPPAVLLRRFSSRSLFTYLLNEERGNKSENQKHGVGPKNSHDDYLEARFPIIVMRPACNPSATPITIEITRVC